MLFIIFLSFVSTLGGIGKNSNVDFRQAYP